MDEAARRFRRQVSRELGDRWGGERRYSSEARQDLGLALDLVSPRAEVRLAISVTTSDVTHALHGVLETGTLKPRIWGPESVRLRW